jgi:hypothetical protein
MTNWKALAFITALETSTISEYKEKGSKRLLQMLV